MGCNLNNLRMASLLAVSIATAAEASEIPNKFYFDAGVPISRGSFNNNKVINRGPSGIFDRFFKDSDIEDLVKDGRYQEAIWVARDKGKLRRAEEIRTRLLELISGEPKVERRAGEGSTESYMVEFEGGVRGIFKPHLGSMVASRTAVLEDGSRMPQYAADAFSEVTAFELDEYLGLNIVPMTVIKTVASLRKTGSFQVFVKGQLEMDSSGRPVLDSSGKPKRKPLVNGLPVNEAADKGFLESQTFIYTGMLDYISGNPDRHDGNWLYLDDLKRVVAIDNGVGFRGHSSGCVYNGKLYSYFATTTAICRKLISAKEASYKAQGKSRDEMMNLISEELATAFAPLNLDLISPAVREKILSTDLEQLRETLNSVKKEYFDGGLLPDQVSREDGSVGIGSVYREGVKQRFVELQGLLEK